jgi:hypothetical protein
MRLAEADSARLLVNRAWCRMSCMGLRHGVDVAISFTYRHGGPREIENLAWCCKTMGLKMLSFCIDST